jgi:hypothetical protein
MLTPGVNSPLIIKVGTLVCSYQCGSYRAILYKDPDSFGPIKYPHLLVVNWAAENAPPIMFVTAEQNVMASEMLGMLPEELRPKTGDTPNAKVFLGVFDQNGHDNLGSSEDYAILDRFETKALAVMRDRLGLTSSVEILNDTRKASDLSKPGGCLPVIVGLGAGSYAFYEFAARLL